MSYSNENGFQRWLDGIFGTGFASIENSIGSKPVKIVLEEKKTPSFEVKSVLSNHEKNAFTVVWADGTTTVVHCQPGDDWDDEKALAMCFTKKALGNKGNFNDKFNDALAHMKTIPAPEEKTIPAIPVADKPDITIDGKWRIVDRPVKVGDYICLKTSGGFTFSQTGDILLVSKVFNDLVKVKAKDHPRKTGKDPEYLWSYMLWEYDVVEPIESAEIAEDPMKKSTTEELDRFAVTAKKSIKALDEALANNDKLAELSKKISDLCAVSSLSNDESAPTKQKRLGHRYNVYHHRIISGTDTFLFRASSLDEVRQFIAEDAKKRGFGFYSRLWNGDAEDMYIDYGSYSHYYHVTGTNIEEYVHNK